MEIDLGEGEGLKRKVKRGGPGGQQASSNRALFVLPYRFYIFSEITRKGPLKKRARASEYGFSAPPPGGGVVVLTNEL